MAAAVWRPGGAAATADVLRTAEQGRRGGTFMHMMDVTCVEICRACLSAMKETLGTFKSRDYLEGATSCSQGSPAEEGTAR